MHDRPATEVPGRFVPGHRSTGRPAPEQIAVVPQKTYTAKPGEIERHWYVVDADGETLGRLATRIADTLRGKRKPQYTPHIDTGDFVVVVNCERIRVTGNKLRRSATTATRATPAACASARWPSCSSGGPRRSSASPSRACCPGTVSAARSCAS